MYEPGTYMVVVTGKSRPRLGRAVLFTVGADERRPQHPECNSARWPLNAITSAADFKKNPWGCLRRHGFKKKQVQFRVIPNYLYYVINPKIAGDSFFRNACTMRQ